MAEGLAARASALMSEHGRALFCLAFAFTGEVASAERVARSAVTRAFAKAPRDATIEDLAAYARRATYAQVLESSKKRRRSGAGAPVRADSPGAARTPDLLPALAALSAQDRIVTTMRFYEGLSCAAIGRDLDVMPVTTRRHLESALDALEARLGDLGLDREVALYGGRDLAAGVHDGDAATDAISAGFAAMRARAGDAYTALGTTRDVRPLVGALHRQRANKLRLIAALSVGVIASMGWAGWTAAEAIRAVPSAGEVSPTPSLSAGPYGPGVLSSADFRDGSAPLAVQDDPHQRLLSCAMREEAVEAYDEDGNVVDIGGGSSFFSGPCEARATDDDPILEATVGVREGSIGRGRFNVAVTLTNTGDAPVAVQLDSTTFAFDRPWGMGYGLQPLRQTGQVGLGGTSLRGLTFDMWSQESAPDVVVLEPGAEVELLFVGDMVDDAWFDDPGLDDVPEETKNMWRRDSSAVGELDHEDAVAQAFLAGDYRPDGMLVIRVAPTSPDAPTWVFLVAYVDGIGEYPGDPSA